MDKITQEDIRPQTERELTSPLSPKRPRTDCTVTNNRSDKSRFDFPELLTFRKTIVCPSSTSILQENPGLVCIAECGDNEDEKTHEQPQDAQLIVTPITRLTHTDDAHIGSSEVCLIAAERRFFKLLLIDEQPPVTATDILSSYPADDADGALAESHTSKDTSADTSSHPDCKRLGKSLEDEPPGGCSFHSGNDEDGRQVQNSVSQIQAFTLSSSDEGVRCQPDCTHEDALHDTGFYNTLSQSAEGEKSNQKRDEHGALSENILFSKEKEEGNSPISSTDYADYKSFYSNPEEQPSGNLAECVKNEEKILELQICENENVPVCDGATKGQVNENGMRKNSMPSAAECAEGSIVSYDVVSARITATESLEADDFSGAKREHAAGEMIAKARSVTADHTTETPMPARISQGPAEGDNDASPFSVIDPAIWSETDREAKEKPCNSESAAGVELYPSVKVCEMETPLPLCSDVRLSQEISAPDQTGQLSHQSGTEQCKDEKEDLRQSYAEPQACPINTNETHNKTGSEGSCRWKSSPSSSPAKPPPAGDGGQESHDTVGHQLNEQDGCVPVSPDHLKTQEVEYLQTEIARMDRATEMKKREGMTSFEEEIRTVEHGESENSPDLEEKLLQQNEKHVGDAIGISTGNSITLPHIDEELGNNHGCLSDHPYSAVISTMEGTTEENERKEEAGVGEETDVHSNSEISVKSEDAHQQQSQQKGDMTEERISECTESNMSKSGHKLTSQQQENKLSCVCNYQHRAETFIIEMKDDLLAFTFPPIVDAVVPGPHELLHSQNADDNPTALNCHDRFSPVPSAFTFNDSMPGGFDTFEKIQLSLDDDDAGLSNSPLLTSLPGQLLKTPQQQLITSMPEAESREHDEVPEEEEEVEGFECHTENTAKAFSSSDTRCYEFPNFISGADVISLGWPEQQPNCESAYNSPECFQDDLNLQLMSSTVLSKSHSSASDVNNIPNFEMKKQFDMVLKELNLYFAISISDFASDSRASSPEQCSDISKALEGDTSNCKEHLSSPELGHLRDTTSDDADEDRSLEMCGGDPVVACTSGSCDGEQEVPLGSHLCQETSMYTAEKHKEPQEMEQKRGTWSPSFVCQPFLEQLSHRQPEQIRRLEPLRTCTRPIRVGLSKRAKTKHLHRPHPYK